MILSVFVHLLVPRNPALLVFSRSHISPTRCPGRIQVTDLLPNFRYRVSIVVKRQIFKVLYVSLPPFPSNDAATQELETRSLELLSTRVTAFSGKAGAFFVVVLAFNTMHALV